MLRPAGTLITALDHWSHRHSKEDTPYINTPGHEGNAKICPDTENIIFHTLLKAPKVSVSSTLTCACSHCVQAVKMLECETFPEFNIVPLDRESHSFSICLRIPNHRMCDKSISHISSCKLQMENTRNLCSSYSLWVQNIKDLLISPLVDSYTTRCFSCWEHEMRLHQKNHQAVSKSISESSVYRLKTPNVWEVLAKYFIYFFFKARGMRSFCSKFTKKSDLSTSPWGHSHGIRTVLHKSKVGLKGKKKKGMHWELKPSTSQCTCAKSTWYCIALSPAWSGQYSLKWEKINRSVQKDRKK